MTFTKMKNHLIVEPEIIFRIKKAPDFSGAIVKLRYIE